MTELLKQINSKYQEQINAKLTISLFPRKLCNQEKKKPTEQEERIKKPKHTQKTPNPQTSKSLSISSAF